jgi:anthranilate synthase
VASGIRRLKSGELFSLVLSQTFRRRISASPSAAFKALRALNPYPAMFFLNLGGGEILFGASPDLQVRADAEWVESAPVCGTYRRGTDAVADADQALALLNSDKEDASLAACADSDRNDKAKVCEPGSLEVVSRRRVHFFSTIIHTIDHIRGRRRSGADAFDILLAHATPATVTGLPKPAAISAIEQLESGWRGWYAGAVARLASDGSMEALTVLRAARVVGDIAEVRTGGNLLVDSDPQKEEEETRLKAETLFRVLAGKSPRAREQSAAFERRFKVEFVDCGDPMASLLAECLVSTGCELGATGERSILVLGGGVDLPSAALAGNGRPMLAIGASALALLQSQGGNLSSLPEPKYARRMTVSAVAGGFVPPGVSMELGLYASQVVETKSLPKAWRAEVVTAEGWVMAASSAQKRQVALLCRPESVQSLKGDAGRVLLHSALAWLASADGPGDV